MTITITNNDDKQPQKNLLLQYVKSVSMMKKRTANEYYDRLVKFERFILSHYFINLDKFIEELREGGKANFNVYDILRNYSIYLMQDPNNTIQTTTLKQRVVTAKNFLEFYDIDISPRKFKIKVRLPKDIKRIKEAIDKNDIVNILNGCSDLRLKTYVMLLASTGCRATEALSIRNRDLDLDSIPAKVTIRGEYTKTKVDRYVFLTKEMVSQLKKWLDYKYRTRRVCSKDKETGKLIDEYRTPNKSLNDLVFLVQSNNNPSNKNTATTNRSPRVPRSIPHNTYYHIVRRFSNTLDRIGMGSREESNERRRKITLHSFRRFVKTTISDLGYADYSEWFIGHSGSTYWRKKDSEKAEIFKKIEPYLTFLNVPQLERQGADLQTKIEELQDINQLLRNKQNEKEEQIKKLEESVAFLADRFNAFLTSQPENKLVYYEDDDKKGTAGDGRRLKGIALKEEINNRAIGTVIPSTFTKSRSNKKS
ncbi:MAG TPA: tyrosine-type recombinase/integrase [Nitrososphaeraceae archaeon]|nr:tyrosine-type recombinase/integrase [Nitrososphaeraceae archaeon]